MGLKRIYNYARWNRVKVIVGLCLGFSFVSFFAFSRASAVYPESNQIVLQAENVSVEFLLKGTLVPKYKQTVVAPFDSVVLEIGVTSGQPVKKGDLLARLDTARVDAELRNAEVVLLNAQDKVAELNSWHENLGVIEARKAVQSVKRQIERSEETLSVTERLFAQGIIPRDELSTSRRELADQQANLISTQQNYQKLIASGSGRQKRIAQLELENAALRFDELKALHARAIIRAPRSGVVEFIKQKNSYETAEGRGTPLLVGGRVATGKALFTIQATDELLFQADVNEIQAAKLFTGQTGVITSQAYPDWQAAARITHISGEARAPVDDNYGTPKVAIEASLEERNEDNKEMFRPGGEAFFSVSVEIGTDLLLLPPDALHFSSEAVYVMARQPDGAFAPRPVEIGPTYIGKTQIISGLIEGDEVLLPQSARS